MIQSSSRSCSVACATTSPSSAAGMSTAPSRSATITSSGNTATPPQPTGCCQATKVSAATEGGAALWPGQEGEGGDGGGGGRACGPDRQAGGQHARQIAHHAIADQGRDAFAGHARA